jgi:tetratricopeptide (TPR) repeat protein
MSNVAKLKKQAAELELKKQFDKALAVYVKLLETFDQHTDELDVALFNRVGDLMLRQGNVADAVDYYEQAVDRYADTGFFNNAIALCNKILRQSPGRASVYYKLGKISAQKGFKGDAKTNFLEYADRMQKAGRIDEAFRALKEFADLCPDQDDIRLMLADQLTKIDRKGEAIEQLQTLYDRYESEGRAADSGQIAERMRAIDPSIEPRSTGTMRKSSAHDLIFLDLDAPSPRASKAVPAADVILRGAPVAAVPPPVPPRAPTPPTARAVTPPSAPVAEVPETRDASELHIISAALEPPRTSPPPAATPVDGVTRIGDETFVFDKTPSESLLGLQSTRLVDDEPIATPSGSLLDLEPTSFTGAPPVHRSSAPTHSADAVADRAEASEASGVHDDVREAASTAGADLELIMPPVDDAPAAPPPASIAFDDVSLATPTLAVPPIAPPAPPRASRIVDMSNLDGDLELIDAPADGGENDDGPELIDLNTESLTIDEDEPLVVPTPSIARRSTMVAAQSVEILKASVEGEPENWSLRRELAEAMLDAGDRAGGLRELETAMAGAEHSGALDLASALAEEMARLEPDAVRHHQKRVEYAFRTNDRARLVEAYLALGGALLQSDQPDKARTVYQRVIDLAPDEMRAQAALEAIAVPELEEPAPPPPARGGAPAAQRRTSAVKVPPEPPARAAASGGGEFVNLGDWLRDDDVPKDTRMVVAEQEPSGDEEADFADMLRKFKQGVAENVDAEDYQSHYDLAIAYKEMGLVDEAIAEFQKALGSPTNRLPTYEALGQCFMDKGQFKVASSILARGLNEPATEEQLVGVLYLLGRAAEEQSHGQEALEYYQRVFMLDIQFRDIVERMSEVERVGR